MGYNFDDEEQAKYDIEQLKGEMEDIQRRVDTIEGDTFRYEDSFAILIALLEKTELSDDAKAELKDLREHFYPTKKEEKK